MGESIFITIPITAAAHVAIRRVQEQEFKPGDRVSYCELEGTVISRNDEGSIPRYIVEWDGEWPNGHSRGLLAEWQLTPIKSQSEFNFTANVDNIVRYIRPKHRRHKEVTWHEPQANVTGVIVQRWPSGKVMVQWEDGLGDVYDPDYLIPTYQDKLDFYESDTEKFEFEDEELEPIEGSLHTATKMFNPGDHVVWVESGMDCAKGVVVKAKRNEVVIDWTELPAGDGDLFYDSNLLFEDEEVVSQFPDYIDHALTFSYAGDPHLALAVGSERQFTFEARTAGVVKTAISLPDIVRETNAFSKKYRPGCQAKLLDSNPKALFLHYNVKCNKEDSDPAGHDVRVQFDVTKVKESQMAKDLDVQVSCSCPAFLYWGAQWNLHQRDGLLGNPRPKLVTPTERLDLRGNYVICKHIHCVFERILPSVQHNIIKLLREREVRKNKEKVKEQPSKLKQKQDEMKRKKQLEKIKKIKNKKLREKMLESLQQEEQARLMHEQELMNQAPPGEIEREEPAIEPTPQEEFVEDQQEQADMPSWLKLPEHYTKKPTQEDDLTALQELVQHEEDKIEEAHKEGLPHLHKGLPYEIDEDEDDNVIHKFESLHTAETSTDRVNQYKPGVKVVVDNTTKAKPIGAVGTLVWLGKIDPENVWWTKCRVRWDDDGEVSVMTVCDLEIQKPDQQPLFASSGIDVPGIGRLEKGMKVIAILPGKLVRSEIKRIDKNHERPEFSTVWLTDGSGHRADMIRLPQGRLF